MYSNQTLAVESVMCENELSGLGRDCLAEGFMDLYLKEKDCRRSISLLTTSTSDFATADYLSGILVGPGNPFFFAKHIREFSKPSHSVHRQVCLWVSMKRYMYHNAITPGKYLDRTHVTNLILVQQRHQHGPRQ